MTMVIHAVNDYNGSAAYLDLDSEQAREFITQEYGEDIYRMLIYLEVGEELSFKCIKRD